MLQLQVRFGAVPELSFVYITRYFRNRGVVSLVFQGLSGYPGTTQQRAVIKLNPINPGRITMITENSGVQKAELQGTLMSIRLKSIGLRGGITDPIKV
jgi:hypothetical protein